MFTFLCAFKPHDLLVFLQEGSISPEPYSDSQDSGTESEEATDDDDESFEDDEHGDATQESDANDDLENASSENCSESGHSRDDDLHDSKARIFTLL